MPLPLIAIVDTTFSKADMGQIALDALKDFPVRTVRTTVPGFKDLAVECKRHLDAGAAIALACGMVGSADIDRQCGHEASLGIQLAKIATSKHILEAFVHENEAQNETDLMTIFQDRTAKHAQNAARLVLEPEWFVRHAGTGLRQGRPDVGGLTMAVNEFESVGNRVQAMAKRPLRLAVVQALFRSALTDAMLAVVRRRAPLLNAALVAHVHARGVLEIPFLAKRLLQKPDVDGIVVLGAVIKGETGHDQLVVEQATRALVDLSLSFSKPVGVGIIGPGVTLQQAEARVTEYAQGALDAVACTHNAEVRDAIR